MREATKKQLSKILLGIFAFVVLAGPAAVTPVAHAAEYTYKNCFEIMDPFVEWRTLEFLAYLDVHFQSKDPNSSLIPAAIQAFQNYKKVIRDELGKFEVGAFPLAEESTAYSACVGAMQSKIDSVRDALRSHIMTVNTIKQQTILQEKYKAINFKLNEMNMLIAKIVAAYKTFENKLPGFLSKCVQK